MYTVLYAVPTLRYFSASNDLALCSRLDLFQLWETGAQKKLLGILRLANLLLASGILCLTGRQVRRRRVSMPSCVHKKMGKIGIYVETLNVLQNGGNKTNHCVAKKRNGQFWGAGTYTKAFDGLSNLSESHLRNGIKISQCLRGSFLHCGEWPIGRKSSWEITHTTLRHNVVELSGKKKLFAHDDNQLGRPCHASSDQG